MTTSPPESAPPRAAAAPANASARRWARLAPFLPFVVLLAAFHFLIGPFFPNVQGGLGHDYSGILPWLMAGRYWFASNGLGAVPWFTPAFCGGQPFFSDPQTFYYSVTQFLAFSLEPLKAVYISALLFAAIGYWGSYWLLRHAFGTSRAAAVVSATLFMFNGFFAYRMVVGHFAYVGFMLLPAMATLILLPPRPGRQFEQHLFVGTLAGLAGAYWVYSGMLHVLLPAFVTFLCLGALYRLHRLPLTLGDIVVRAGIATTVTVLISVSRLVSGSMFLAGFPRTDYLLPGMKDPWQLMLLGAKVLFFPQPNIDLETAPRLANLQWALGRHEFEYGVGVAALALLLWWLVALAPGLFSDVARAARVQQRSSREFWLLILALVVLLAVPFALNFYTPEWNATLKQLPLIKSSSNLVRWFALLIPVITVACGLIFNRIPPGQQGRLALVVVLVVLISNFTSDDQSYHTENYRDEPTRVASAALSEGNGVPPITRVLGDLVDPATGKLRGVSGFPNDQLVAGYSTLACYNPIFGYRLEHFPVKTLHDGSPTEEQDGVLNFKNPACYAFPEANQCAPGDHFKPDQIESLKALLAYKPYPFAMPTSQHVANAVTLGSLALSLGLVLVLGWRRSRATPGS